MCVYVSIHMGCMKPLHILAEEAVLNGEVSVVAENIGYARFKTIEENHSWKDNYSEAKLTLTPVHPYSIHEREYRDQPVEQDREGRYTIFCGITIYPKKDDTTGIIYTWFGDYFYYIPTSKTIELAKTYSVYFTGSNRETLEIIFSYFYDECPDLKMED